MPHEFVSNPFRSPRSGGREASRVTVAQRVLGASGGKIARRLSVGRSTGERGKVPEGGLSLSVDEKNDYTELASGALAHLEQIEISLKENHQADLYPMDILAVMNEITEEEVRSEIRARLQFLKLSQVRHATIGRDGSVLWVEDAPTKNTNAWYWTLNSIPLRHDEANNFEIFANTEIIAPYKGEAEIRVVLGARRLVYNPCLPGERVCSYCAGSGCFECAYSSW